jgi:hypothetical protein
MELVKMQDANGGIRSVVRGYVPAGGKISGKFTGSDGGVTEGVIRYFPPTPSGSSPQGVEEG